MGSASYRWFHNGCCECVSKNCVNYGIDRGQCAQCPITLSTTDLLDIPNDADNESIFDTGMSGVNNENKN